MRKEVFWLMLSFLVFEAPEVSGQKNSFEIGGKLLNEFTFGPDYAPGIGAQVIYRMTKRSGIESGLYYKTRPNSFYIDPPGSTVRFRAKVAERNLVFPFLYRFDSRKINFTIGPALKYFLDWKFKPRQSDIVIKDYIKESFELIATVSISKNFYLPGNLVLEPEIRFGAFVPNGDGDYGVNIALRKKIF